MKNNYMNFIFLKTLVLVFLLSPVFGFSAGNNEQTTAEENNFVTAQITIAFGETLPSQALSPKFLDDVQWTISGSEFSKSGKGASLNDIKFEKPGTYEITLQVDNTTHKHSDECSHSDIPNKIILNVQATKIKFMFDQIVFSKNIKGGRDLSGETIELPVMFESYDKSSLQVADLKVISAGVGSSIQGELSSKITLSPGLNKLSYKLKGSASKDTFIMFDFLDSNGQSHSYYYPTKIN